LENNVTHLGLDVHKDSIAVAVLRPGELEPDQRVIANTPDALRKLIARVSDRSSLVACYEAGPTGYGTQRLLASLNVACDVIAPSLVPKRSGDRVKTDRLDARNLARLHRAGELTPIRVPTTEEEALRDLVRLREDLKDDRRRMQHRIKSFLLRHDRRCPDHRRGWSRRYRMWVSAQRFEDSNTQLAFDHLLAALNMRTVQLDDVDRQLVEAAARPPLGDAVARLRTFRGLDTLSALTIASEVCDFRRFPSARSFMGFTGLVPSEHSSGLRERRGSITKAATHTFVASSSKRRGATGTNRSCVRPWPSVSPVNNRTSLPTPGRPRCDCTRSSGRWPHERTATSPPWQSLASSPASSGGS
jgi:transposase